MFENLGVDRKIVWDFVFIWGDTSIAPKHDKYIRSK
jgi:hypothetical protein